jgi:arachidonate 15-lipoxygenase
MNPLLPQDADEASKQARNAQLEQQRKSYEYDYEYLKGFALLKSLPNAEQVSPEYAAGRLASIATLLPNNLATKTRAFFDPLDELQDYEDFFNTIELPKVARVYQTNDSFAEQRLSGVNPLVLRLLKEDDLRSVVLKRIPSYAQDFEPLFDVPEELKKGNIYVADYTGTDPEYIGPSLVQGGSTDNGGRKYLPKPLAFFWWRQNGAGDRGKLVPIAIQLDASKDRSTYQPKDSHVYTPFEKNDLDWLFAKFCVQIADINHHEMSTHLGRTHFVMEPIAIGTARQLAENHPLSLLLRPHMRFILFNNYFARDTLLLDRDGKRGPVSKLLAGNMGESKAILTEAYKKWGLKKFSFWQDIKDRGLDNEDRLPHYPYRDDGKLVWEAVEKFVASYLRYFYPNDLKVQEDTELQAWARELADQNNGGKVKEMPDSFTSVETLIEIVTTIIFICGPQHSAINFAQADYIAFVANMPLAAYRDIPEQPKAGQDGVLPPPIPVTKEQIMNLLPPHQPTAEQLDITTILSNYRFDRLGYYDKSFQDLYGQKFEAFFTNTGHPEIVTIVQQFQQNLNMAEQKIDANNSKRVVPYPYFKPSLIINSISM